jgi:putative oxidoreductase
MAIALLIARLVLGGGMFAHGAQKLFGWFGGYGIKGTGGWMESMGFKPGNLFAAAAGLGEAGGGLLTALGIGGPLGPALIVMVMIVAILTVHLKNGFWQANSGYELNTMYISGVLILAFVGFGPYSLDTALGIDGMWTDSLRWIALGVAVLLALGNLMVRRTAGTAQPAS